MPATPSSGCPPGARSPCPIANTLDLLGDKWTLLVVRDLMIFGKKKFGEFVDSAEGIPTNILTERLRRLEAGGIVRKTPYQKHPVRYEYRLTAKGRELWPVLKAMIFWAKKNLSGIGSAPPGFMDRVERSLAEADAEEV